LLLIASLAVGCGDDDNTTTPDQPAPQATPTPSPAPPASPAPTPAPPNDSELQSFFGTIDAIGPDSINLSDRIFEVTSETLVFDHQTPIQYSDLKVGQTALIKARKTEKGWLAREIKLREP
jgi:hypothetical protein